MDYVLDLIVDSGIDNILLLAGYNGEQIRKHYENWREGIRIQTFIEHEPMGTGGALKQAESLLDDVFLLVNGDTYLEINYAELYRSLADFDGVICAFNSEGSGSSRVEQNNIQVGDGRILRYAKGTGDSSLSHVDSGAGVFRKAALNYAPNQPQFSFEEYIWPILVEKGSLGYFETSSKPFDIGTPERYDVFADYIAQKRGER